MIIYDKKKSLFLISLFSIFAIGLGISYAFFSYEIIGNDSAANINLQTASVEMVFVDGAAVNLTNITPGASTSKIFRVENNSSGAQDYSLIWTSIANGFSDRTLLTYSIACVGYSDYVAKTISSTSCLGLGSTPSHDSINSNVEIISSNSIPAGDVQEYTVTFTASSSLSAEAIVSFSGAFGIAPASNASTKIYGVTFNNATVGTRTDDAVGLSYTVNTSTITSDFDNEEIYKYITEETDSYGNVFMKIPKFYIKKTKSIGNVWTYQISRVKPDNSYYLPECFKNQSTDEILDYVLVGKYNASLNKSNLESKSGSSPSVAQTPSLYRTYARNNGAGYQIIDIHIIDILQTLFYVEFATLDSQSIMYGYANANSSSLVSGTTDGVTTASGSPVSNTDGKNAMKYRGIENLYGNLYQAIDGINIQNSQAYIAKNPIYYESDVTTGEYVALGYVNSSTTNYILEMGYDVNHPYANYPLIVGTGANSIYKDAYYISTGNNVVHFGGYWTSNNYCGISFWYMNYHSGYLITSVGSRLVKKAY